MRRVFVASAISACIVAVPGIARADLFVTPYVGVNFGGSAGTNALTGKRFAADSRPNLGATLTWLGTSGLGFEVDLGFIPDFFAPKDLKLDLLGSNNVTTVMANIVLGRKGGGIQPYLSAGGGLLRSQVGAFGDLLDGVDNGLGVNAGAGVRIGPGRFSIRGDVRYFRNVAGVDQVFEDVTDGLSFWRATTGLSIGF
jgi:hypothetical protein